ncbi:MAG: CxxC-x17-CxxC domain-containing protein [Nitrosopumilus sp.]
MKIMRFRKDMSFDREREMHTATCGDCGNECQVPFQPKEDRPVYCRECFQNHKPAPRQGGGRFGGRSGGFGGDRGSRFGRRDDRPREMHDAKCGDCGTDTQVPFKPKEDRPVYCRECFQKHRN